ncbi:hypothetical protein [Chromatocurvus halotolerans]|uniref:Uncharacterized protein n=1 Tax=Chromatocurvus halotolerans TaxID=1132028 RepID=A0A4R2KT91_9GAMM|nr:hypothetical protein [Chromatocurvus halotolerans]TCO74296.1 hypothetical protein EV688_1149 [Chromatocurvus halotolerans]
MHYIRAFFLTFLAVLAAACAVNWFVDPYGMYWSPVIDGVNAEKPASVSRVRVIKAYRAPQVSPEILLVGNSRVEMGLSPLHPAFTGKSVYNLGLPGASVAMQLDYALNTVRQAGTVNRVIIGVDFLDFLYSPASLENWDHTGSQPGYTERLAAFTPGWQARWFRLQEKAALVFSLDSLFASVESLFSQDGLNNSISPRGQNAAGTYQAIIATEGIKPLFVQKIRELEARLGGKTHVLRKDADALSPAFSALAEFLDAMHERDIKVDLFINPYHFSYVMLLDNLGLADLFLEWKALLVDQNNDAHKEPVPLWDFSGFGQEVMEPLPRQEVGQAMTWFWEPAHYREQLGDKVIERIMAGDSDGFGVRMTEDGVSLLLKKNSRELEVAANDWANLKKRLKLSNPQK